MTDPFASIDAAPAKSDVVDDTQTIRFTDWTRADRSKRQIIATIEATEAPGQLEQYMLAESLMIDALFLFDNSMSHDIEEAYRDHKAILKAGQECAARIVRSETQTTDRKTPSKSKGKRMANLAFKTFKFTDVELLWPRLEQTYRYNSQDKKTEACPPSVQNAGWSIGFLLPLSDAKEYRAEMQAHYDDCKTRDSKLPDFDKVFGMKRHKDQDGNETDFVLVTAKKRAVSNDGNENKAPKVMEAGMVNGEAAWVDMADKAIWSGSEGHVRVVAFPTVDPDGTGGISLLLDAVLITKAEYGSDNLEEEFGKPTMKDPEPTDAAPREGATDGGF